MLQKVKTNTVYKYIDGGGLKKPLEVSLLVNNGDILSVQESCIDDRDLKVYTYQQFAQKATFAE